MSHLRLSNGTPHEQHEAAITALAAQTRAPVDIVRHLYEEELAALDAEATVKNFIGIIAGRRVKQRLRALHTR